MNILFMNKFFFLNGGVEAVLFQERDFMARQGHRVIDFSMRHPDNVSSDYQNYFVSNVDYHEKKQSLFGAAKTAVKFVHNREAVRNIEAILTAEKPHVAHLHNIYHQITPSVIPALKKAGVKVVLTLHDYKLLCPSYYMLCEEKTCAKCAGRHFYHVALRPCHNGSLASGILLAAEAYWHSLRKNYEMVDLFLAPSQFMADLMSESRIDKSRIVVLRNGIDTAQHHPSSIDKDYILYFGRISKEKGMDTLLTAYKELKVKIPLKIVGTGPYKEALQMRYPDTEFTGYRTGDALKQLISEASFIVVPSDCYENCSMSVLEAMAYGKPVIGSNIGGIPEQIEHGTSGFLFEHGDARDLRTCMTRLIQDKTQRRAMGEAGRRIIEQKFSLHGHCNKLVDIYKELISQ